MAFLTRTKISKIGFAFVGKEVSISDAVRFYNPGKIRIDDHCRIDDFCILSAGDGGISIGRYVHVACYCALIGKGKITLEDFSGLSSRVSVYSSTDDFSGAGMAHPTVPEKFRNQRHGDVLLKRHALIGAGCIILPGVKLGVGVSVGAMSLVKSDLRSFGIYAGVPVRRIAERSRKLLILEKALLQGNG